MSTSPRSAAGAGAPAARFDLAAMARAVWRPLALWLVGVIGATAAGYPGVACATPMAWLLALWTGHDVVAGSRNPSPGGRLVEAAGAGGLLGLVYGVVFVVVMSFFFPVQPDEAAGMAAVNLCLGSAGVLVCAGLSLAYGALIQRRMAL